MTKIEYGLKLYQTRSELARKGVKRPVKLLVDKGILKQDDKNWNLLNGRVQSLSFLDKLIKLNDSIE